MTAAVYDVTGRRVATLADRPYAAGAHRLVWSAAGLAAGAYVVHIEAGETRSTQRLTVLP